MQRILMALAVPAFLLLSACSTGRVKTDAQIPQAANLEGSAMEEASAAAQATIKESEVSSEDVEKNIELPYKSAYGDIPMDQNEHVEKWVRYFTGKGRKHMKLYLERSARYLPMMKNVLRENGLPEDLVYIAMIESGFSPRAHSKANAVGYWQFIRSTGKRFGLTIDTFTDERRDPVLSTRAAAEYFKALHNLLGSWHLAMASYNVGESRVKRSVTRYYTRDFWKLIKQRRSFPSETKNYVPKFIAAAMIGKDPAKYGFTELEYQDPLSYDTVALQSPISLSKLASNLSVEIEELQLLNPKFRTDYVPISRGTETVVRIPVGRATDALAALSMSVTSQPRILQAEHFFYRIRRGDNLSTIAKKHRTTVSQLRRLNNLSNRTLLRPGRSLKVPDNGGEIRYVTEEDSRQPSSSNVATGPKPALQTMDAEFHTVRNGDNLSTIAKRYGMSVSELLKLNTLGNRSLLRKGQKIRIRPETPRGARAVKQKGSRVAAASGKAVKSQQPRKHLVRRGETMWDVSKRYGVALNKLAKHNNVRVNHRVMAGQKLLIPE